MKPKQSQTPKQPVKLPSIANKTMGDISKDTNKQRQRPLSSKNIVNDLEKKLFSQLQSYDQKSLTSKAERGSSKVKTKANSTMLATSCREITTKTSSMQSDSMDKIAQLMPQLYSKIILSKKYEDPKPLKETFSFTNQQPTSKQHTSIQIKKKPQKSPLLQSRTSTSTRVPSAKSTKPQKQKLVKSPQKQKQPPGDSFDFAQREIDSIYNEYLQMQGLDQQKETSAADIKEMNDDLNRCQVDIEQLERNYSNLIKQLGDICLNELE